MERANFIVSLRWKKFWILVESGQLDSLLSSFFDVEENFSGYGECVSVKEWKENTVFIGFVNLLGNFEWSGQICLLI